MLETPLSVTLEDGRLVLRDGELLVASARPTTLDLRPPDLGDSITPSPQKQSLYPVLRADGQVVRVCWVEGNSAAFFRIDTGVMESIVSNHPDAGTVLRQVRILTAGPTNPGEVKIAAPSTGSGGLR